MNTDKLRNTFEHIFGFEPRLFRAPGRVNLIGEHTDYNEGFVLPFAIDREVVFAGVPRTDTKIIVHALDIAETFSFDLNAEPVKRRGNWIDYVEGGARCLLRRFPLEKGADLAFSSTVPMGAGLSSSAALEVAIGYALLSLHEIEVDRRELAFASQEAEHEFVGIRSGIMDQFASVLCQADHALLVDCRSLEIEQIPLEIGDAVLVVCDTKVKHTLASSEYNTRRRECESGVEILREKLPEIKSLRDVSGDDFAKHENLLPENVRKRCRHVITENARTLWAVENLRKKNLEAVGRLMYASHASLRDDYEVSCPELDKLVEFACEIDGVLGARMTGGGFGGCTVNLVKREVAEEFREEIGDRYFGTFGLEPEIYLFRASDGASEINRVKRKN